MEENKKSKKGLIFVIALILGLIVGIGGSYYYFNVMSKDSDKTSTVKKAKSEKIEYLETTDKKVTKSMDKITGGLSYYCGVYDYYKDKKITADNLDDGVISSVALHKIVTDFYGDSDPGSKSIAGYTFTADQYEKAVKSIFKVNKIEHKSLRNCPSFTYDESTKKYTAGEPACGGTCGPGGYPITKVTKALIKNNTMEVYMRILFVDYNNGKPIYYYDYAKTKKVLDVQYNDDNTPMGIEYSVDDKAALYKITFEKDNNNYVFVSAEPVND